MLKKFRAVSGVYFYDSLNSNIIKINEFMYNTFYDLLGMSRDEYIDKYAENAEIEKVFDKFRNYMKNRAESNGFSFLPIKNENRKKNPFKIVIGLTEACNLKCKYCIYSDSYSYTRTSSTKKMSYTIADKFIRWIDENYNVEENLNIGFYGGEPLLNFDIMKYIVKNLKELPSEITFSITTNGYAMSEEHIDFFLANKIRLFVSVDGTKEIHDKYRIALNGEPTYDRIMNNLKPISDRYPDYYREYVNFVATAATPGIFVELFDLQQDNPIFSHVSMIWDSDDAEKIESFDEDEVSRIDDITGARRAGFIDRFKNRKLLSGDLDLITSIKRIHFRNSGSDVNYHACSPGNAMLFVSPEGNFHMCEKIDHAMPIGDLDKGIISARKNEIERDWLYFKGKNCSKCWGAHLCDLCYVSFVRSENISPSNSICSEKKSEIEGMLQLYVRLLDHVGKESIDNYFNQSETS